MGVEGDPVDDRGDQAGIGHDGSPLAERQVAAQGDAGAFLAFGDDLEQQLGAPGIDLDVAQFVERSRSSRA